MPRISRPSRLTSLYNACLETLETRRLLCSLPASAHAAGLGEFALTSHVPVDEFLAAHPDLVGKDLYSPSTFDPKGSNDPAQYRYDPHMLEDPQGVMDYDKILGIPQYLNGPPATGKAARAARGGGGSGEVRAEALPDFFPLMYQVNSNLDLTSQPGRALLKFGTQVNNQGAGPASLISGRPGVDPIPSGAPISSWVNPDGSQNVIQAVYNYTGSGFTLLYYRAAGRFTYHTGHQHFHFDGYADYKLRHRLPNGTPGGYVQRTDGTGVVGSKTGFCLLTFSGTFTTEGGQNSSSLPGYNQDTGVPSSCGLLQGIRTGRYDQYSSGLEGQWIDVAGVTPGQYFVEISLDGENAILESNEGNNAKSFAVTIPNYTPGTPIVEDNFDLGGANNDTFATAHDFDDLGSFLQSSLTIHWGLDYDYFKFTATSSGVGTITSSGNGNIDIYLYDGAQNPLDASSELSSSETLSYNFVKGQTYYVMAQAFNSTTSNNYQLNWNIKPTVDASAPTATASAATGAGVIRIERNGPVSSPLVVNLTYSGTAVPGVDYDALPASIAIGNEASYVEIPVTIRAGATINAAKTVIATISNASTYAPGVTSSTVTLLENVKPVVTDETFNYAGNPQAVVFNFNEDVGASLDASDILLVSKARGASLPADRVLWQWNAGTQTGTATFEYDQLLNNGDYHASIAAADVVDVAGNPLAAEATLDFSFLYGDITGDGAIDFDDYVAMDLGFNGGLSGYANGDLNRDGSVDFDDYVILDTLFNGQ